MNRSAPRALLCLGLALMACAISNAQILLQVDVSNPAAVTFTATTANSAINFDGSSPAFSPPSGAVPPSDATNVTYQDGIVLLGFFRNALSAMAFGTGIGTVDGASTLGVSATSGVYFDGTVTWDNTDTTINSTTAYDFNIYQNGGNGTVLQFNTSSDALSGVMTVDFTGNESDIPLAGTSGNIVLPYGNGTIGTYSVTAVPEPSTYAILFGVAALFGTMIVRHRRLGRA